MLSDLKPIHKLKQSKGALYKEEELVRGYGSRRSAMDELRYWNLYTLRRLFHHCHFFLYFFFLPFLAPVVFYGDL